MSFLDTIPTTHQQMALRNDVNFQLAFDLLFKCTSLKHIFSHNLLSDVRPVQNKLYTPTANGCGSLGLHINTEYLPAVEMENCCNEHDICYDTCNSNKDLCDLDFKRCLYKYCETIEKSIGSEYLITGCKAAAKVLFTGTLTLGCKSYLDSQKRSCYCAPPKQSKEEERRSHNGYKNGNNDKYYKQGKKQKYGWKETGDM